MTDATTGTAAPPKKRSFFKKAAWQTAAQAGEGQELDMFSHSNEFRDIIAEETRKKNEERRKVEEAHKRKAEEQRERKRRRVSLESEERQTPRRGSGSSTHGSRICSNRYVGLKRPRTGSDPRKVGAVKHRSHRLRASPLPILSPHATTPLPKPLATHHFPTTTQL